MAKSNNRLSLYIVRHCSTSDSKAKRYSDSTTPLNDQGEKEAYSLARKFQQIGIDGIFSSPYQRALETGQIIQGVCQCSLKIIDDLREVDHGLWTGYTAHQVKKIWEKEFTLRGKFPKNTPPPGGETLESIQKRTLVALKKILSSPISGKLLIVAHGGNIHTLWMYLLHLDLNDFWNFSKQNQIDCGDIFLLRNARNLLTDSRGVSLVKIS